MSEEKKFTNIVVMQLDDDWLDAIIDYRARIEVFDDEVFRIISVARGEEWSE